MKKEEAKAESRAGSKAEARKIDGYVREHLRSYVSYMLRQGYTFEAIEGCLLHYGYSRKQLDSILEGIDRKHHVSRKSYKAEELDKETFYYLRAIISEYIKKQIDHGYHLDQIKTALINYGHDEKLVNGAFAFIGKKVRATAPLGTVFFVSLLLLAGFVFLLGITCGEEPQVVAIAFLPALITITVMCGLLSMGKLGKIRKLLPILALMIVLIAYMGLISLLGQYEMEYGVILGLNAAAAFMLSLFMVLFSKS